jgi:hypothetical protein
MPFNHGGFVKSPSAALRFLSPACAGAGLLRRTSMYASFPQDSLALHLALFTLPSTLPTFYRGINHGWAPLFLNLGWEINFGGKCMKKILIVAVAMFFLAGCASMQGPGKSGFLGEYAGKMTAGPEGKAKMGWVKPGADFSKYKRFMVDYVVFALAEDSDFKVIDGDEMKKLGDAPPWLWPTPSARSTPSSGSPAPMSRASKPPSWGSSRAGPSSAGSPPWSRWAWASAFCEKARPIPGAAPAQPRRNS